MKKLISLILAVCMLLSLSVTAMAANDTPAASGGNTITGADGQKPSTISVRGIYEGGDAADKISVDITWEDMTFTYSMGVLSGWNPASHSYTGTTGAGWLEESRTITVTNHSNVGIEAAFAFEAAANVPVDGSFTQDSITLATAENTEPENAPSGSTGFGISGEEILQDTDLGTISVTITKTAGDAGGGDMPPEPNNNIETWEDLQEAIYFGGRVVLDRDIDLGSNTLELIDGTYLDLNDHTLSGSNSLCLIGGLAGANVTICNGTIVNTSGNGVVKTYGANFTVNDCALVAEGFTSSSFAIAFHGDSKGTSTLTNCTLNGHLRSDGFDSELRAVVVLSGNTAISGIIDKGYGSSEGEVYCKAGTYNFDPSEYLYSQQYVVAKDGEKWVVTES